jgi:hypothetical protein
MRGTKTATPTPPRTLRTQSTSNPVLARKHSSAFQSPASIKAWHLAAPGEKEAVNIFGDWYLDSG